MLSVIAKLCTLAINAIFFLWVLLTKLRQILKLIIDFARYPDLKNEKQQRSAFVDPESFGTLLGAAFEIAQERFRLSPPLVEEDRESPPLPCIYIGTMEEPLRCSMAQAAVRFDLDYLEVPSPKIFITPKIVLKNEKVISCEEVFLFESSKPGMVYQNIYYCFKDDIKRKHLRSLSSIRNITIPEPLFWNFCRECTFGIEPFCRDFK